MKYITRSVWILSLVSLFTDTASEMLYPIMPIYLKTIGFSIVLIGVLEGIAEATAGLSKGYFGKLSDTSGKRVPFVQIGYAFSAVSKPMMAMFVFPLWIFFSRTLDRLGKGIRTGARDALLSDEATPATKAKVFGFHRSMDTFGAVLGPSLALLFLYYYPEDYKALFYLAFIPGLIAVMASFYLRDGTPSSPVSKTPTPFFAFMGYWKASPPPYRKLVTGLLLFTLVNSSDIFLLLKAKESGLTDTAVIGAYIFYNLVYAMAAYPIGVLADTMGLKKIYIVGLALFALVYFGMAWNDNGIVFFVLFLMYGLYAAATEGVSKAWISNITDRKDTATAIGTYSGFQSICTLLSSTVMGIVWYRYGATAAFLITATGTAILLLYFFTLPKATTFGEAVKDQ